ncbi:hypothetical protein NE865_06751 [Phthorimaea operculella]|nr:hypothetical protein NE865_06751 [Phthorimaea operculella]
MSKEAVSELDVKIEVKTEPEEPGEQWELDEELRVSSELKHPAPEEGTSAASASVRCTLCDKRYPSRISLEKHKRYQHLSKARCRTCYRNFQTDVELTKHQNVCKKSEVACPECSKVYKSEVSLRNHVKYKHPTRTEHWCESCRRSYSSARSLANHTALLHAPNVTVCTVCAPPRVFPSAGALRSHTLYRHTPSGARCHKCCKVFATPASLDRHRAKNHGDGEKRDGDVYILSDLPK